MINLLQQITRPILVSSVLISITSVSLFGVYHSFSDIVVSRQAAQISEEEEEEEMKNWSSTLSDPKHPNYNSFDLTNN